jgi:15-cis-phytoene synthase
MNDAIPPLPPPHALAIVYTRSDIRDRLRWLLAFDGRLLSVLHKASEPMIAQLRLSWWRDALSTPVEKRPKGEPLLAELFVVGADNALLTAAKALVDAYEILATQDDPHQLEGARVARMHALAGALDVWVGGAAGDDKTLETLVQWWSAGDGALPPSLPKSLRPLTIVAMAEHLEQAPSRLRFWNKGLRLNWHALTGR